MRINSMSLKRTLGIKLAAASVAVLYSGMVFAGDDIPGTVPAPGILALVAAAIVGAIAVARLRK